MSRQSKLASWQQLQQQSIDREIQKVVYISTEDVHIIPEPEIPDNLFLTESETTNPDLIESNKPVDLVPPMQEIKKVKKVKPTE